MTYADSLSGNVGFFDISNPASPRPAGVLATPGGSPTSVAVAGNFLLVGVDTSSNKAQPSGNLLVVNLPLRTIVRTIPLSGQADSVAVSPDRKYAAIAIENERDEEYCAGSPSITDEDECEKAGGAWGVPPQNPPGFLVRVVLTDLGNPASWTTNSIQLTGVPDKFPTDPEPEFVDINNQNVAVVTLQENNSVVLVDLAAGTGTVTTHFSAGFESLTSVDTDEDGVIQLTGRLNGVPREPDGVNWIDNDTFVTADEGDLEGGIRGFTIFNRNGGVLYRSGNQMEHIAARSGTIRKAVRTPRAARRKGWKWRIAIPVRRLGTLQFCGCVHVDGGGRQLSAGAAREHGSGRTACHPRPESVCEHRGRRRARGISRIHHDLPAGEWGGGVSGCAIGR